MKLTYISPTNIHSSYITTKLSCQKEKLSSSLMHENKSPRASLSLISVYMIIIARALQRECVMMMNLIKFLH